MISMEPAEKEILVPRIPTSPGKPRTKTQRARELLRKAINNGTIREVLWGKDFHHYAKDTKKVLNAVSPDDDPNMISLEEAALLDSVAIWNKALVARILKTAKIIESQKEQDVLNAKAVKEPIESSSDEEVDPEEAEKIKNKKAKKELRKKKRQEKKRKKLASLAPKPDSIKEESAPSSEPKPETSYEEALFTATVAKKPRRVSDIIKSVQANAIRMRNMQHLANVKEDESDSDDSDVSSTGTVGSEGSRSTIESSKDGTSTKDSVPKSPKAPKSPKVRWGGAEAAAAEGNTKKKAQFSLGAALMATSLLAKLKKKKKKQEYSLQVVEGLFNMSNELREERESIMAHGKDGAGNMEAFINRETTLKYNEELDAVSRNRTNEVSTQRKAALLRLKRAAVKYKTYKSSATEKLSAFWDYLLHYNDHLDRHQDAYIYFAAEDEDPPSEVDEPETGGSASDEDSDDEDKDDTGRKSASRGLESMFEENLGMLFATKHRAASEMSQRMGSRGSSTQSLHSAMAGGTNRRLRSGAGGGGGVRFDDIDENGDGAEDSDKFLSAHGSSGHLTPSMRSGQASASDLRGGQRNLSSMIERMKAMGVYSEEKFRYTYGVRDPNGKSKKGHPSDWSLPSSREKTADGTTSEAFPSMSPPMDHWLADSDDSESYISMDESQGDSIDDEDNSLASSRSSMSRPEGDEDEEMIRTRKQQRRRRRRRLRRRMLRRLLLQQAAAQTGPTTENALQDPSGTTARLPEEGSHSIDSSYGSSHVHHEPELTVIDSFPFPVAEPTLVPADETPKAQRKKKRKEQDARLAKADAWLFQQISDFARAGKATDDPATTTTADNATSGDKDQPPAAPETEEELTTFITEFLHYVDVNPFNDHTQGEERAIYHKLLMEGPQPGLVDPTYLHPADDLYPQSNSSLRGRWRYDPNLPSLLTPKVYRQIRRAVVKKLHKRDRFQSRHRPQYAGRERYHIHYRRNIYKELVFDPERRHLVLRTCEDHEIVHSLSVHVSEVYLTDAAYQDMVTVRTTNTSVIPSGYLGTFPVLQWRNIEEEINSSLMLQQLLESNELLESLIDGGDEERKQAEDDASSVVRGMWDTESSASSSPPSSRKPRVNNLLPFQKLEKLREETQITFRKFPSVQEGPGRDHIVPGLEVHPHDSMVYRRADARVAKRKAALLAMENELDHGPTEEELFPLNTLIPKLEDVVAHPATQHIVKEHLEVMQTTYEATALEEDGRYEQVSIKKILAREIAKKEAAEEAAQVAAMTRVMSSDRLRQRLAVSHDVANAPVQHAQGYEAIGHVACGDQVSFSLMGVSPTKAPLQSPSRMHPAKPPQPKRAPSFRTKKLATTATTVPTAREPSSSSSPSMPMPSNELAMPFGIVPWDDSTVGSRIPSPFATTASLAPVLPAVPPSPSIKATGGIMPHLLPGASTIYRQYLSPYVPGLEKAIQDTLSMTSSIISTEPSTVLPSLPTYTSPTYLPPLVRWPLSSAAAPPHPTGGARMPSIGEQGHYRAVSGTTGTSGSSGSSGSSASSGRIGSSSSGDGLLIGSGAGLLPTYSPEDAARMAAEAAAVLDAAQLIISGSANRPTTDGSAVTATTDDPEQMPFSYAYQIIMLIETRRIMQLYFTKKFLQMDIAVNIHLTFYDATESLLAAPDLHGLIFVSYLDLVANGVKKSLDDLIPASLDKSKYTIIVYDVAMGEEEDNVEELAMLEDCGVTDILYPPYTVTNLKEILEKHKRKQEMRREFR